MNILGAGLLLTLVAMPARAITWDVQADFSLQANGAGAWTYGYLAPGNDPSSFRPFSDVQIGGDGYVNQSAWVLNGDYPRVTVNTGGDRIDGTVWFHAGAVSLHPGRSGEAAVIRWTAPQDVAALFLDSAFMGLDFTTTDVHVALNGLDIFSGDILPRPGTRWGDEERFAPAPFAVSAGDTIDFRVGYLDAFLNGGLNNDTTGLRAVLSDEPGHPVEKIDPAPFYPEIRVPAPGLPWPRGGGGDPAPVPLPGSLALLAGAVLALAAVRRRFGIAG
jgi:hypothetical protein